MAEKDTSQDKTEEPTAKKLKKAREEGNVSLSKEVSSIALLFASLAGLVGLGSNVAKGIVEEFQYFFKNSSLLINNIDQADAVFKDPLSSSFQLLIPFFIVLMITALITNLGQTGGLFSFKLLEPKFNKLNPISGVKKIISIKGLVELLKSILKLSIVTTIVFFFIANQIDYFVSYVTSDIKFSTQDIGPYIIEFVVYILLALFLLSIGDAIFQRFQYKKDLKMTKQEVKDEFKEMEGDPRLKAERRQFGLKLRRRPRLDHAVLSADVIVTNPTHFAVCLMYNPDVHSAPIVLAKGQRLRALKIKELAAHYGTPVVENKPVARALFATSEEGETIPSDLFKAVAEILAFIFEQKNKLAS
jgi:flagellar biosynthetic protein FlhB